jgi:hypothetical protein
VTAPDPQSGPIPPPRPPAGPVYPPVAYPPIQPPPSAQLSAPPDPMSGPPGSFSGPPAPYSVSPAAPASAKRSRGAGVALGVAALALLVAVVSLVVAWRAVDQAGDAKQFALAGGDGVVVTPTQAAATAPVATTQAPPPASAAAADEPVDPAPTGTGEPPLDERTVYTPKYQGESLTLKMDQCGETMAADLDEPRANTGAGVDIVLNGECSNRPAYFSLGEGVAASQTGAPGMTPQECGERIRTAPLGESTIPVRQGSVICLRTSFAEAVGNGDSQRLVVAEVTGTASDGAVTIKATAWNIPR